MKKILSWLALNKIKLGILFSFLAIIVSSFSVAYAWMAPFFDVFNQNNRPGQLDSDLDVRYWNKASLDANKWEAPGGTGSLIYGLGEMLSIAELPTDSNAYLKLQMADSEAPYYEYKVLIHNITINVSNGTGPKTVADIDYYTGTPTQQCFDYYYVIGDDDLLPTTVFSDLESLTKYQITTINQNISPTFIDQDQWLYLMLKPRLSEAQNIIRKIPIEYSPYTLTFTFAFNGETRTPE